MQFDFILHFIRFFVVLFFSASSPAIFYPHKNSRIEDNSDQYEDKSGDGGGWILLRVVDVDRLHGHQNHEDGQNCAVDNNSNGVDYSEVVFVDGDQEGPAYGGDQDEDVHAGGDAGGGV